MVNFSVLIFASCIALLINIAFTVRWKSKELKNVILINAAFAVFVSTLSLFYSGIYVDEMNLAGEAVDTAVATINVIAFIVIFARLGFQNGAGE